jgi:hypothetical protein
MIYRSNNKFDKSSILVLLPWASIPCFWGLFIEDLTIYQKLAGLAFGIFLIAYPIYNYVYKSLEITFEDDFIKIKFPMLKNRELNYSYTNLKEILFTDPPKYGRKCRFDFIQENKKHRVIVDMGEQRNLIALIDHCAHKNSNIKFRFLPVRGDLQNWVKKELVKKTHNIN